MLSIRRLVGGAAPALLATVIVSGCSGNSFDPDQVEAAERTAPRVAEVSCLRLSDIVVKITADISPLCVLCGASHPERAADSRYDTSARLSATASEANFGVSVFIETTEDVVFPVGSRPGIYYSGRAAGTRNADDLPLSIRTYLNGQVADDPESFTTVDLDSGDGATSVRYFETSERWDTLEIRISNSEYVSYDIFEACWDINSAT